VGPQTGRLVHTKSDEVSLRARAAFSSHHVLTLMSSSLCVCTLQIIDVGFSMIETEVSNRPQMFQFGTPGFMAPEVRYPARL